MRQRKALTLAEAVVLVVVVALGLAIVSLHGCSRREKVKRTVCMSNLSCIGKALVLYKGTHRNRWPWIPGVTSDFSSIPTGRNRGRDPNSQADGPSDRSITSLMFLLVREHQPVQLFICPSTRDTKETNIRNFNVPDDEEPEYYWDFSGANNVSYSWQAPVKTPEGFRQGLSDNDPDAVVAADKTPLCDNPKWSPDDMSSTTKASVIYNNMSANHDGEVVNVLYVGMNVAASNRPDVGANRDNIYTASGHKTRGSRSATSLDISKHLSTRDSFLIGPVRGMMGRATGK